MWLLKIGANFLILLLLDLYLKLNIANVGEVGRVEWLVPLFLASSALMIFVNNGLLIKFKINKSIFPLLIFISYFIFKNLFDIGSLQILKNRTIGTSGGIILFYLIGALASTIILKNESKLNLKKSYFYNVSRIIKIVYGFYYIISLLWVFIEFQPKVRLDIILLENEGGGYQRAGNFLAISYILYTMHYFMSTIIEIDEKVGMLKLTNIISFSLIMASSILSILIAQIMGSNSATVTIFVSGVVMIVALIMSTRMKTRKYLETNIITLRGFLFGKLGKSIILFGLYSVIALAFLSLIISFYFDIDLSKTRMGGFGYGDDQSIGPRIEIIKNNFITHLAYSPILGNMNVDCLTTGCGTYMHSLVLSILTHTGFVGLIVFSIYLALALYEKTMNGAGSEKNNKLYYNALILYTIMLFVGIFTISSVGHFFVNICLWFTLGLSFPIFNNVRN